jgi:tetratricopeptide (TPR) repeat protein/serine/threonine protein kinase
MAAEGASLDTIFCAALEIASKAERAAYVAAACGDNQALRAQVEKLLAAHFRAGSFLEQPAEIVARTGPFTPGRVDASTPTSGAAAGDFIGAYKLGQEIGEGGMGTVWMAQQAEPVKRLVALKLIKPGMDSRQVIARFEAERQALALMDHPNIARVFDAGTTDTGRPYFVMELVKGVPLTGYCDEHRLTPKERLELFVPVCQAVQHAHQKGIIHRDLKPSNVLVALYDGKPVPKVIDFGIAKATGQQLTDKTLVTGFGNVVGTLEYMSPEQAELNQLDIDTRSDVYAMGVLLYELLTGSTPLEKKRLKEAALLEVLRVIREEEPPRPSTRLSTTDELPSVAANRGLEPKKLSGLVRGELDWIVMKALDKDRNRRYETANGFAQDIQRYLADEPVQACPPSGWYRFRKFTRRNKTALVVTGLFLVFIALLGGGGGWILRDRAARQARAASELELALERTDLFLTDGKRAEAAAALERAEVLVGEFLTDPDQNERLAALKERLASAVRDQEFIDRFERIRLSVQSRVNLEESHFEEKESLPEIQHALHQYGIDIAAMTPAEAAVLIHGRPEPVRQYLIAALDECLAWAPPEVAQMRQRLFAVLNAADNDGWRMRVRKAALARDEKALAQLARTADMKQSPGSLLLVAQSLPTSMSATQLELLRRIQSAYPADLWANQWLAYALNEGGAPAEAVRYYTAALALRPKNPGIYLNRGNALLNSEEVDAAIADYRQAVALAPQYTAAHNGLGNALRENGLLDEAIAAYREAIRLNKDYAKAHNNLGNALKDKGLLDDAIAAYREAIRLNKNLFEPHNNLGIALHDKRLMDDAIAEYREAMRLKKGDPRVYLNLGVTLMDKTLVDDAIAAFSEAIRLKKDFAEAHYNLGIAREAKGLVNEAIAAYREAVRLKKDYASAYINLGNVLRVKGLVDDAIAAYREAIRLRKDLAQAHYGLGNALTEKRLVDDAIAAYREAIRLKKDFAEAHYNLGGALRAKGLVDEAISAYRDFVRLKKDDAPGHNNLAGVLMLKGRIDEAILAYREAIRLKRDHVGAHFNLGIALSTKKEYDAAIAEYREAIRLDPKRAAPHYNLGKVLHEVKKEDEAAIAEYQEAIRLDPNHAEANCNLADAYRAQGRFAEAFKFLKRGHELGSRRADWPFPSADWLKQAEQLLALDNRVAKILSGEVKPAGAAEQLVLARFCQNAKRHYAASARFYAEAFTAEPRLADDLRTQDRYNAACAAALAGCGQGKDADKLDAKERAGLRRRAQDWLRADLEAAGRLLAKEPNKADGAAGVAKTLQHWLVDPDFADVRGPERLAQLPEAEQQAWRKLWVDVDAMLARARPVTKPKKQPNSN